MGQVTIHNVPPGNNVVMLVRAVQTGSNGTTYSDFASLPYASPTVGASGGAITTTNSSTNIQLVGGSLFAVGSTTTQFPNATGTQKFFNDVSDPNHTSPITLSGATGVILNQYGVAAYKTGTPQFVLDATTGKAFFAGTVTAGAVKIGPGVDPTGLKNGIWINDFNYWYDDGSWSAKGSDIAGALIGPKILKPVAPTGLTSSWNASTTLTISWTFDTTAIVANVSSNQNTKDFLLTLTAGGVTKTVIVQANKLSSAQSYVLTPTLNKSLFGIAQTIFTSITVAAEDTFGNIGPVAPTLPTVLAGAAYNTPLLLPTSLPLVGVNNGYTVSYTTPTDPSYSNIEIAESTTSSTGPWTTVYSGTLNPVTIIASNLNPRWVQAKFVDILGESTNYYTNPVSVTPVSPVTLSTAAPQEVPSVSAAFTNAGLGEDILLTATAYSRVITAASGTTTITYTTGTTVHNFINGDQVVINGIVGGTGFNVSGIVSNATSFTFQLTGQSASGTPTSFTSAVVQYYGVTYIAKLTSGFHVGYFYLNPTSYATTALSWTITKASQFAQFGSYYSSFTGNLISVSISGIRSAGSGTAAITTPFTKTSNVTSATPSPTILNIIDGYSITFDYSATTATSAEVYQRFSTTTAVPALAWALTDTQAVPQTYIRDAITVTAVSGSGTSIVVTSPIDNDGFALTGLTTGYPITGTGILPASSTINPTFITNVAANTPSAGQYTLTLNTAMTGSASGTYTLQSLAYSGSGPASVYSNYYTGNIQVAVRYYDDFNNGSNYFISASTYQPINPTTSLINSAVQVSSTGSIYLGTSNTSVPNVIIGTNSSLAGIFVWGPSDGAVLATQTGTTTSGSTTVTLSSATAGVAVGQYVTGTGIPKSATVATVTPSTGSVTSFTLSSAATATGTVSLSFSSASSYTGTTAGAPSTQIIGSSTAPYSFITKNATIADWNITSTSIENTLSTPLYYTGLSGSGTYAIWAGASNSQNSTGNANFSVTPSGNVLAKNISIIGSGTTSGITAAGSGTVMTYTSNTAHGLSVGQHVTITGLGSSLFNVTDTAIASIPTTTTFTIAGTGTGTATGTTVTTAIANPVGTTTVTLNTLYPSIASGMIVTGTGVPANTYVISATPTAGQTVLLLNNAVTTGSAITLSFTYGGTVTPVLLSAGGLFNVTGMGAVSSTSANITGTITAQSGSITGNLLVGGSAYSGTPLLQSIVGVLPGVPAAGSVRYALSAAHSLTTNSTVYVSGISPSGYSGTFKVTGVSVATTTSTGSAGTASTAVTINTPNATIASGQYVIGVGLPSGGTTVSGTPANSTNFTLSQAAVLSNTTLTFVSSTALGTGTGTATASTTVTLASGTSGIAAGQYVIGAGVPNGTTVVSRTPTTGTPTSVVLSNAVTLASIPLTFVSPTALTTAIATAGTSSTTITITVANAAIIPGMIVTGSGVPTNTYVITYGGATTLTLNNPVFLSSAALTFTAGTIDIANATTVGATISSAPPIAQVIDITSGYILNQNGLTFNTSGAQGITRIDATTGLFTTTSASIGGWLISDTSGITKTSGSGTLKLDATNAYVSASSLGFSAGLATPNTNAASDVVFWAGSSGARSTANPFYVTASGALVATSATISGNITANAVVAGTSISTGGTFPITISSTGITSTNFNINASTGAATFTGTITASAGTIGGWTVVTANGRLQNSDASTILAPSSATIGTTADIAIWTTHSAYVAGTIYGGTIAATTGGINVAAGSIGVANGNIVVSAGLLSVSGTGTFGGTIIAPSYGADGSSGVYYGAYRNIRFISGTPFTPTLGQTGDVVFFY
jgi:hypothetical protein